MPRLKSGGLGERIEMQIPAEPPVGSVVVDEKGRAWQSYSPLIGHLTWVPNASPQSLLGESPVPCSWSHLLARGPVTVVWRTPAQSTDSRTPVEE